MKHEVKLKGKRELTEDERGHVAMEQLFPPLPAGDASAEELALTDLREAVMNEVWRVMGEHEEER